MMKVGIKIGDGGIRDSFDEYGLIYLRSDSHMGAPIKDYDVSSYAEEPGEHVDPRTVLAPFDFHISFFVEIEPNREDNKRWVNTLIDSLNNAMFITTPGTDVVTAQRVAIYDFYKGRRIVGMPKRISEPEEYYNVYGHQIAVIKLILRVDRPQDCAFDYYSEVGGIGEMEIGNDFIIA